MSAPKSRGGTSGKPKRKRGLTAQQCAEAEFEPWEKKPGLWEPPTNDQWCNPLAPTIRVAWATMFLSKAEMMTDGWWSEPVTDDGMPLGVDAIERMGFVLKELKVCVELVEAAQCRLLSAGSVVSLAKGWER